jgi:hypothetical protein
MLSGLAGHHLAHTPRTEYLRLGWCYLSVQGIVGVETREGNSRLRPANQKGDSVGAGFKSFQNALPVSFLHQNSDFTPVLLRCPIIRKG